MAKKAQSSGPCEYTPIARCLVKCDIVQTKCPAGVWTNVTLSRQNVLALSKSLREHWAYKLLSNLDVSKSSGPDEVPARLLREDAPWLADPITRLLTCLCNGVEFSETGHPQTWHWGIQERMQHLVSNYRLISLTCFVVRVLEKLVHNHLIQFLTTRNKLSQFQHGFH